MSATDDRGTHDGYLRRVEPVAAGWRRFVWHGGALDSAYRPFTDAVEGIIRLPTHLVLLTLEGTAERQEVWTSCGHSFRGGDRRGMVSFLPAGCERRLHLRRVKSRWASISLDPTLTSSAGPADHLAPFTNVEDPFIAGLVGEIARLHQVDGALDLTYCDALSLALAHYLVRRASPDRPAATRADALPPWRLRRIEEYVDAHLDRPIRIAELAAVVGLSAGHLHRSLRSTTGQTPLQLISARRIRRAVGLLAEQEMPVIELAARVGFTSPSHFARTYRRLTGVNPSQSDRPPC